MKLISLIKQHRAISLLTVLYAFLSFFYLGSFKVPETYWYPDKKGVQGIIDLGQIKKIDRVLYYFGLGAGQFFLSFSDDQITWRKELKINQPTIFSNMEWRSESADISARYIRISAEDTNIRVHELAFVDSEGNQIPVSSDLQQNSNDTFKNLWDEPHKVDFDPTFLSGMYMDEDYHARAAIEQLERRWPSESTHPPLGKVMIGLGIGVFGQNTIGWRSPGAFFGILMIPLIYLMGLALFKKSLYAFIPSFLLAFDFMHFTQTRIAAVDAFATFFAMLMFYFMILFYLDESELSSRRRGVLLALSGLSFGLGVATKWSVLYGGLGLAVLFFIGIFTSKQRTRFYLLRYFIYGVCFFCLIPFCVYLSSYFHFTRIEGVVFDWPRFIAQQQYMYSFHSGVKDSHPFMSPWWEWPLVRTPIWYYTRRFGEGQINNIVAMGNPMIWWAGFLALPYAFFHSFKNRSKTAIAILIMIFSLYLPWVMGIRSVTFIYHFCVISPFWIILISFMFLQIQEQSGSAKLSYLYIAAAFIFFVLFYPVISGYPTSVQYQDSLRWLPKWYW